MGSPVSWVHESLQYMSLSETLLSTWVSTVNPSVNTLLECWLPYRVSTVDASVATSVDLCQNVAYSSKSANSAKSAICKTVLYQILSIFGPTSNPHNFFTIRRILLKFGMVTPYMPVFKMTVTFFLSIITSKRLEISLWNFGWVSNIKK
jgi:hypothetical protein